jgi:hypothetical protein
MYYIGPHVPKKTISYCVKDATGGVDQEGKIGSTVQELDVWVRTLPEPRMMAMEATHLSRAGSTIICYLMRRRSRKSLAQGAFVRPHGMGGFAAPNSVAIEITSIIGAWLFPHPFRLGRIAWRRTV